eukprot:TRINITY_DN13441_c0_g2_i1.p1 TRINITY_DN13441_c0_g2~~TRINITY_DN13441_c0_g2_i1.p1  ORF type:complete len:381 (-),score=60.68 TRINITY_DN13441_c0_g2_i1:30-1007(-)
MLLQVKSPTSDGVAEALRYKGKEKYSGKEVHLRSMNLLLIEPDLCSEDWQLEQIIDELKRTDCNLTYSPYEKAQEVLIEQQFRFDAIIIISSTPYIDTKRLLINLIKVLRDNLVRPISFGIVCSGAGQSEYSEFHPSFLLHYPIKEGDITKPLAKLRGRKQRKQTIAGDNINTIDELYQNYNISSWESMNHYKILNIMIADDDSLSNNLLQNLIEKVGKFQVFPFFNGKDAVAFYTEKGDQLSAIFLDIEMPGMNGIEAARNVRSLESSMHRKRIPIIGLTAHQDESVKSAAREAGMDLILPKPLKRSDVLSLLKKCIQLLQCAF